MRLIEPYAGTAAFACYVFWLMAGSDPAKRKEPPVSRQGGKSGFCVNEFRAFGLVRKKWDAVLLNDLDPVCHLFHMLYASSDLRDLVARRLFAMVPCPECLHEMRESALDGRVMPTPALCLEWLKSGTGKVEDPDCSLCSGTGVMSARVLWERIRKEPVLEPTTLLELAWLIAYALFMQSRSFQLKPASISGGAWNEHGYKKEVDDLPRAPTSHAAGDDSPRWTVAERVAALPGRWVGLFESGTRVGPLADWMPELREGRYCPDQNSRWTLARRIPLLPGPGGCHIGISRMDALAFVRGLVLGKEDVLLVDGPYAGTAGYAHDSKRDAVLEICDRGRSAGALVICHESVGLAKELGPGWHERCASPLRGRSSTFHKDGVEREWITSSVAPCWWPAEQGRLF